MQTAAPPSTVVGGQPSPDRRALYASDARTLIRLAGPIVLSQIGAVGMHTTDTIMVGPLGAEALAAIGLAGAIHWGLIVVTMGILFGMSPLVAQAYGRGDRESCRRVLVQGLWLAAALSVPVFLLSLHGERIALMLGQDAGLAVIVGQYLRALAWGILPMLFFVAVRQFLEGMGMTRPAMVITFIGLAVNFVANGMFIYGAGGWVEPMGAVGSGWATTAVRWAMLAAMAIFILRHPDLHPFRGTRPDPERGLLLEIVRIGVPTGVQGAMEVCFFGFGAVMMGWFGPAELGTHQVTINIAASTFMVALGVSLAGSILVGQRIGAEDVHGTRRAVILTYLLAGSSMALFAVAFVTIPRTILGLYTHDPDVIELGVSLLFMAALFQIFDGTQVAGVNVLRGAADTRIPMFLSGFAYWMVGAPSAYFLAFHTSMGPVGVWAGMVIGLAAVSIVMGIRAWLIHWRRPLLASMVSMD